MPDRGKVIKGLEQFRSDIKPFCGGKADWERFDAGLALLKEQEPTTFNPHYIDEYGKHFICGVECGSCHEKISRTYHYCPYCGKEVKWE